MGKAVEFKNVTKAFGEVKAGPHNQRFMAVVRELHSKWQQQVMSFRQ